MVSRVADWTRLHSDVGGDMEMGSAPSVEILPITKMVSTMYSRSVRAAGMIGSKSSRAVCEISSDQSIAYVGRSSINRIAHFGVPHLRPRVCVVHAFGAIYIS